MREKKRKKSAQIPKPTEREIEGFYEKLSKCPSKPAILSITPSYSNKYIPKVLTGDLPVLLPEITDQTKFVLTFDTLISECAKYELPVLTENQVKTVEQMTQRQSMSKAWFQFRSGRIIASKMKSACYIDPDLPSQSLIKQIFYTESAMFCSKATNWGCKHEKNALEEYAKNQLKSHSNMELKESGFVIFKDHRYIGTSSDSVVMCDCCGLGSVEVKCPYCVKWHYQDGTTKMFKLRK